MLAQLENSALVDWFLSSMWGFPTFIAVHSVGMAIVVGVSLFFLAWSCGLGPEISRPSLLRLLKVAWLGFVVNALTGLALIASRAREYLTDFTTLSKLFFVFVGVIFLSLIQAQIRRQSPDAARPSSAQKCYAAACVLAWIAAVTTGRWIAYLSGLYK